MLDNVIPASKRKIVYAIYAVTGFAIGSVQAGFLAAEAGQPVWLTVALGVYAYIGVAFGTLASGNTDTPSSGGDLATGGDRLTELGFEEYEPRHAE